VRLESRSATGMMLTGCALGGTAVAASVAIPKLMAVRMDKNEQEAQRRCARSSRREEKARVAELIDRDRDGHAGVRRLDDLNRSVPAQGRADGGIPQLLDVEFQPAAEGCWSAPGICSGSSSRRRPTPPAPPRARTGRRRSGPPTACQHRHRRGPFIAYAWPRESAHRRQRVRHGRERDSSTTATTGRRARATPARARAGQADASMPKVDRLSSSSSFLRAAATARCG
jgi:hypothetical protein